MYFQESNKEPIFTVSEFTRQIKQSFEEQFNSVWIRGEISNLAFPSSGHIYFTLKDNLSQIKVVLFRNNALSLRNLKLEEGMGVIVHGSIGVYERRGEYQIIIDYLQPDGVGSLYIALEQLKKRLEAEGLFSKEHKKPLPMIPKRIGIITSPTGAVIKDILKIIKRRFSNLEILISPVKVQGEDAPFEIIRAIRELNITTSFVSPEVIILARGGGSIEDLWAFNNEGVARAIFESKIPIISAIGHETDFTIADFVADLRAPTPSAAAELVVKQKGDIKFKLDSLTLQLSTKIKQQINQASSQLQICQRSLLIFHPQNIIRQFQLRLDDLTTTLLRNIIHQHEIKHARLSNLTVRLEALSPLSILARGYSVTLKLPENKVVKDANLVKVNDLLKIIVANGKIHAHVGADPCVCPNAAPPTV